MALGFKKPSSASLDSGYPFQQSDLEFSIEIAMSQQKTWDAHSLKNAILANDISGADAILLNASSSVPDVDIVFQPQNRQQLTSNNPDLAESFF